MFRYSEIDQYPYPYFFRGHISSTPCIFARQAGWRPQLPLAPVLTFPPEMGNACFQIPCNTVLRKQCLSDGTVKPQNSCNR